MQITKRNLWAIAGLTIITFGIYLIYWVVVTKGELNRLGAQIPSAILYIIPLANIYFLYKFAEGFTTYIVNNKSQTVSYFLLIMLLPPIGMLIYQSQMNKTEASSNL